MVFGTFLVGVVYTQHYSDLECLKSLPLVRERPLTCDSYPNNGHDSDLNESVSFVSMRGFCDEKHSSFSLPTPNLR